MGVALPTLRGWSSYLVILQSIYSHFSCPLIRLRVYPRTVQDLNVHVRTGSEEGLGGGATPVMNLFDLAGGHSADDINLKKLPGL